MEPSSHSAQLLAAQLERYERIFDTIEAAPLTREQRVAALTDAPRVLAVAAAGSGKTSTIVGKIAHALCSGQCQPQEILCLAFNAKAACELRVRLRDRLSPWSGTGSEVAAQTLHALGLAVISKVEGRRPRVLSESSAEHSAASGGEQAMGGAGVGGLLGDVIDDLLEHDTVFLDGWLVFRFFYDVTVRHPDEFANRRLWRRFVREHGERNGRAAGFITRRGELLPTQFEQGVADWLHLHAVDYRFLRRGGWPGLAAGGMFSRPLSGRAGFYLPRREAWLVCVDVSPPEADRRGPRCLWLSLEQFRRGLAFATVRAWLYGPSRADADLPQRNATAVLARLEHPLTQAQGAFLRRFVRTARLAGADEAALQSAAATSREPSRTQLHTPMLARLLHAYAKRMDSSPCIDFEGMLHRAAAYLDAHRYRHPYRLVLVDEFQDTSAGGLRLLQSLLAQAPACRLFAVGDDWQSIYRFAGAVPDILSRFKHYFPMAATVRLTATFRFDQCVADAATAFIQQNPAQLRKTVRAQRAGAEPPIVLDYYFSSEHMHWLCEACLASIAETMRASLPCQSGPPPAAAPKTFLVYILGRYRHQRPGPLAQWRSRFPSLEISYQTIHSVKGLEADAVIILGLHAGRLGFPCERQDDALMELVLPRKEHYPHAEERRLFYVALTRTRGRVYLLADACRPSAFVGELLELQAAQSKTAAEQRNWVRRLAPEVRYSLSLE